MCGIIGYIGNRNASEVITEGLKRLEYRGYDSVGMAVAEGETIRIKKDKGMVKEVSEALQFTSTTGNLGLGHCLHLNTHIQLADGTVCPINEIKGGQQVTTLDPNTLRFKSIACKVAKHKSPKYLYEIKTSANSIISTGEHKMFVASGGSIIEKKVADLQKGDLLICASKINIRGTPQALLSVAYKKYYKYNQKVVNKFRQSLKEKKLGPKKAAPLIGISKAALSHFINMDRNLEETYLNKICEFSGIDKKQFTPVDSIHGKNISIPTHTSENLLQFLGYLTGDGFVSKRCIRFKDPRKDVLERYAKLAKKLFNLDSKIVKIPEAEAFLLEMNSKFICDWIKLNFPEICQKGRKKTLPKWLGKVPDEQLRGFIKGFYDAEACCGMQSHQLKLVATNESTIRSFQFFLLRFGIRSSFAEQQTKWGSSYILSTNTHDDISKFIEHIGLTSKEKKSKLDQMVSEMTPGLSFTYKPIPIKDMEINQIYRVNKRVSQCEHQCLSTSIAKKFVAELEEENYYPMGRIKKFFNSNVVSQEIKRIRKIKSDTEFVYDIEVPETENFLANALISHNSRWATHGSPCKDNAHPFTDCEGKIVLAHNGVIENYLELKKELSGHKFSSETDSETIVHLIEEEHKKLPAIKAFISAIKKLKGSYAVVCTIADGEEKLYVARKNSPLVLGIGKGEMFAASDIPAILPYTKTFVPLEEGDIAILFKNGYKIYNLDGEETVREPITVDWSIEMAEKGGYPHYMLKEINDQKHFIHESLAADVSKAKELLDQHNNIDIIACGTSYHAGLLLKILLSKEMKKRAEAFIASEYQFIANPDEKTLAIAISQSGETADTLQSLKFAKQRGAKILSLTNVVGSSITRISDVTVYLNAGPEISVAATKTFTSQAAVIYKLIGLEMSSVSGLVNWALKTENHIKEIAAKIKDKPNLFFIGRGLNYPVAMEGALKLKEISYLHAEAYAGGELKHGPLSLIEKGVPVIAVAPKDESLPKLFGNIKEVNARGAYVIALTNDKAVADEADESIELPEVEDPALYPFPEIIILQLLAYHVSVLRGIDPDKPRNLAKSVTVE